MSPEEAIRQYREHSRLIGAKALEAVARMCALNAELILERGTEVGEKPRPEVEKLKQELIAEINAYGRDYFGAVERDGPGTAGGRTAAVPDGCSGADGTDKPDAQPQVPANP